MASEYLKWKYRDEKPREKRELTPAEKRKNWWYYHKWHVVGGAALVFLAAALLYQMLGIGEIRPDYQFAYVAQYALPDETVEALEAELAKLGTDQNGDGKVTVFVNQYPLASTDPQMVMAIQVKLMADLSDYKSCFFLLDDPEQFQKDYQVLCRLDGSLPEDGDFSAEGTYLLWDDCPALAGLDLGTYSLELIGEETPGDGNETMHGIAVARRGFWTEQTVDYPEGCQALWSAMTAGAVEP